MKTKQTKKRSPGFSLVAVMFFMAVISTFLVMLQISSSQQAKTARRLTGKIKAQAMSEAGCEHGYALLVNDWDARKTLGTLSPGSSDGSETVLSTFSSVNSADAETYTAVIEPVSDVAVLVNSVGTYGSVTSLSIISVQNIGGESEDGTVLDDEAFDYAILCGGAFTFRGCGTILSPGGDALFHANGIMDNSGNTAANINLSSSIEISSSKVVFGGDITAPSFDLHKKVTVAGTKNQKSVSPIAIPDIDLTPYYNWALDNGEVYSSMPSGNHTPVGGIMWINGSADIKSTINGSVIATGDISVLTPASAVNAPANCAFAIVSRNGDITMNGGDVSGLVYAKSGSLYYQGNGLITGQVIINGDIKNAGNSDIMAGYNQSIPAPPGGGSGTDNIVITAWQK